MIQLTETKYPSLTAADPVDVFLLLAVTFFVIAYRAKKQSTFMVSFTVGSFAAMLATAGILKKYGCG